MKNKWCANEDNKIVSPTKRQSFVASERSLGWGFGSNELPSGIPRPRLTCKSCKKRFLGEVIYDTNDAELLGFRVPPHVIRVVKKTRKTWDQNKTK